MKITLKIIMLFFACALTLCGAELGDSAILATVDGDAVTLGDVVRESGVDEAIAARAFSAEELSSEIEKMRRDAVDRIINRKLYVREFQRLNLELPRDYVDQLLDEVARSFGCRNRSELARKAREAGTSIAELRQKASNRIMADMIVGREVYTLGDPTPREIYEYFKAHESEYSVPERINPALLLLVPDTPPEQVKEVQAKLAENPDSFPDLVKAFSAGPNKDAGGSVGWITRGTIRQEFQNALPEAGIKTGMVLGPVVAPEGTYFIRIIEFDPGKKADLSEHKEEIKARLAKLQEEEAIRKLNARLRKDAVIRYYFGPEAERIPAPAIAASTPPVTGKTAGKAPDAKPAEEQKIAQTAIPEKTAVAAVPAKTPEKNELKPAEPAPEPAKQAINKMEKKTMVTLKTNFGDIKLELYPQYAPKTVANFLEYVKSGFYNGTLFHRVINDFMIQGGGFDTKFRQKATREPIENEADNRLSNETGTIAMARTSDPHSATAQFFINVADNDFLDFRSPSPQFYGYCVFGKVVEGMDVVNKIKVVKTGGRGGHQDVPKEDVVILEAVAEE